MMKKIRAIGAGILAVIWLGLCLYAWVKPANDSSESERRKLAQFPKFTVEALLDGSFMEDFADYAVDQFPLRDGFRSLKALFQQKGLLQKDNNGYYLAEGYIVKQTYPLNKTSLNHAVSVLDGIYKTYLEDTACKLYYSVVPDKGYYLAGYPAMDYTRLQEQLKTELSWAQYIDITPTLNLSSYYRTDTHWRQEALEETASVLCQAMGAQTPDGLTVQKVDKPFYGVYYGHAALPVPGEDMYRLESEMLSACTVVDLSTGKEVPMYDDSKLESADMYEMYLSGNQPLLQIHNPNAEGERELVIFRDSFGSSVAPLLAQGYKTVTLVDVRYMNPEMIGQFITFDRQDVLFLYSTLILNESATLRK